MANSKNKLKIVPLDFVVMAAILFFIVYVIYRVDSVLIYNWDWSVIPGYLFRWDEETSRFLPNLLIKGLITTVRISVWALILSTIIGVLLGIARTSKLLLPRLVGWVYVEFIRNIPPVPFLFLFYFFISSQIIPHLIAASPAIASSGPAPSQAHATHLVAAAPIPAFPEAAADPPSVLTLGGGYRT